MRNYYDLDNEIWGLPWNASNPVMYYNPDMFTAAGLDPDQPPQTFEEITAACEAIMKAQIEGLGGCINWPVNSWLPEQWLSMQNALFVNNDNGRSERASESLLNSPEMLKIITWWKDLKDKGYFIYSGTPDAYTAEGLMFVSQRTAMHLSSSAGINTILTFAPQLGKFTPRIAPFPVPDANATNGVTPGGAALWVLAGHPDAETQAAVDFVFYLINTENIKAWHKASGYFPIRQSAIDELTAEGWFDTNPAFFIPLQQLLAAPPNTANAGARIGASVQVRTALIDAIMSVLDNGEDPAAALDAAKSRADKAIKEYNSIISG
jgi:sn-glycerol 3-phosphate transport system substrate-binding protein